MKTQKLYMAAILSSQILLAAAPQAARADDGRYTAANGGPQEAIINMGLDALKSIGGEKLKELLFPTQTVDYERIKKDMEEVTKKQIINAQIDVTMGKIGGAAQNARSNMFHSDPVMALENTRQTLVGDVSTLTAGEFKNPALGNVVQGEQTEFSILTAMLEKSPVAAANDSCDRNCVIGIMKDRLATHIQYTTTTANEVLTGLVNDAPKSVGACEPDDEIISDWQGRPHIIHHGFMYEDRARGFTSGHWKVRDECDNNRDLYVANVKTQERITQMANLKWIYVTRASWSKALLMLEPNMTLADQNKLVSQAITDVAPAIVPKQSACYYQLAIAVKGSPNACETLKKASDYYKQVQTCPQEVSDLYTMVGCK